MRLSVLTIVCLSAISAQASPARTAGDAEAQLRRVESRIRSVTEAVQADVAQRDSAAAELRRADQALAIARQRFEEAHGRHVESVAHLSEVRHESAEAEVRVGAARTALAAQLRAAYVAGPDTFGMLPDPLELASEQRLRTYAAAVIHARSDELSALSTRTRDLLSTAATVAATSDQLASVEADRQKEAKALERARRDRAHALAQLQSRITSHGIELKELKSNATALEDLLKRLQTALAEPGGEEFGAVAGHRPFADLRGKLPWPVHGAVAARFGDARAGGLLWNGILLDTHRGAEIRAVAAGRVAYADWLPGLGLLLILDHGGGWMTLYGYNGRLLRNVGDRLRPGDVLAESQTAADAGKPQLYFEIREAARAIDPARFLKGTSPP